MALDSPILVFGAPRSGTTWLAKIIDSHPDVLYRHEPDTIIPSPSPLTPEALPGLLAAWASERSLRAAAKQPLFPKRWQPAWARWARVLLASAAGVAAPLAGPLRGLARAWVIPDLGLRPASRLVIKSIAWGSGAPVLARSLPGSRTFFILRHPCGQVASVMRGHRARRFDLKTAGTDMPFDEAAAAGFAALHGINDFPGLLNAAKYAWSWRAFNEPAHGTLAAQPNVQVVIYDTFCAEPQEVARRMTAFAELDWTRQTQDFVTRSTLGLGASGYYTVFRNTAATAEQGAAPCQRRTRMRSELSWRRRRWRDCGPIWRPRADVRVTTSRKSVTVSP